MGSPLQELQRGCYWLIHYRLHVLHRSMYKDLRLSTDSIILIEQYNTVVKKLKQAIEKDYKNNREAYYKAVKEFKSW